MIRNRFRHQLGPPIEFRVIIFQAFAGFQHRHVDQLGIDERLLQPAGHAAFAYVCSGLPLVGEDDELVGLNVEGTRLGFFRGRSRIPIGTRASIVTASVVFTRPDGRSTTNQLFRSGPP